MDPTAAGGNYYDVATGTDHFHASVLRWNVSGLVWEEAGQLSLARCQHGVSLVPAAEVLPHCQYEDAESKHLFQTSSASKQYK